MENHINYIGKNKGPLEWVEAHGLSAIFNSALMDKYFRCSSGNTQVNATEIKLLKMPSLKTICQIGRAVLENTVMSQKNTDHIVNFLFGEYP